jgi:hypothetical protein
VFKLVLYAIKYQYINFFKKCVLLLYYYRQGMQKHPSRKSMGMSVLGVRIFHRTVISSDFRIKSMQYIFFYQNWLWTDPYSVTFKGHIYVLKVIYIIRHLNEKTYWLYIWLFSSSSSSHLLNCFKSMEIKIAVNVWKDLCKCIVL